MEKKFAIGMTIIISAAKFTNLRSDRYVQDLERNSSTWSQSQNFTEISFVLSVVSKIAIRSFASVV